MLLRKNDFLGKKPLNVYWNFFLSFHLKAVFPDFLTIFGKFHLVLRLAIIFILWAIQVAHSKIKENIKYENNTVTPSYR